MITSGKYCFSKPKFIDKPYGWVQHIPFAFHLIEFLKPEIFVELGTHSGNSYFSFCQAVDDLKLSTKCYAIDTWEGDAHASFYDKEVYERVKRINSQHFPHISYLLRMKFDEGLPYFSDGSIDLLHIDGLHTYEAVKHDYESWLPKMSDKGVIIFHDTNVRERDFGVWKLFEEIRTQYPSFEFLHGHGLGILCVGKNVESDFLHFVENANQDSFIHHFFATLGNRVLAIQEREDIWNEIQLLKKTVKQGDKDVEKREKNITALKELIEKKNEEIGLLKIRMKPLEQDVSKQGKVILSFESRQAKLQEAIQSSKGKIDALNSKLAEHKNTVAQKNEKVLALEAKLQEYQEAVTKKNEKVTGIEAKLKEYQDAATKKNEKVTALETKLKEYQEAATKRNEKVTALEAKLQEYQETVTKKNEKVTALETKLQEYQEAVTKKNEKVTALETKLKEYQEAATKRNEKVTALEAKLQEYQETVTKKNEKVTALETKLQEYQEAVTKKNEKVTALETKLQEYKEVVTKKNEKVTALENRLQEYQDTVSKKNAKLEAFEAKQIELQDAIRNKNERIDSLEKKILIQQDTIQKKNEQVVTQDFHLKEYNASLVKKSKEIAKLETKLEKHQDALANKNERISIFQVKIAELQSAIEKKNEKIVTQDFLIKEYKETVEKRDKKIATIESKLDALKENISQKNEKIISQEFKIKEFGGAIDRKNEKISSLEQGQSKLQEKLVIGELNLKALNEKLKVLNEKLTKNDEVIFSLKEKRNKLEADLHQGSEKISLLEENQKELNDALAQRKSQLEDYRKKQDELKVLLAQRNETVTSLKDRNLLLKENLDKSNTQLSNTRSKVETQKDALEKQNQRIQDFKEAVERRDKKISDLNEKIERAYRSNEKLASKLSEKESILRAISNSRSWRFTKPLRDIGKAVLSVIQIIKPLIRLIGFAITFQKTKLKQEIRFLKYLRTIRNSNLFDRDWYVKQYPDVAVKRVDPASHFVRRGAIEGRNPSANFNTKAYLEHYDDVAQSGINPLVHYINFGKAEGRRIIPCATSSTFASKAEEKKEIKSISKQIGELTPKNEIESILYVIHEGGGGMIYTSFDLFKSVSKQLNSFLLQTGKKNWTLYRCINENQELINEFHFQTDWNEIKDINKEREDALESIVNEYGIKIVHVRVLIGNGPSILNFFKRKGLPIVFSFHDFSAVCPNIQLINNGNFCYGDCSLFQNPNDCKYSRTWYGKIGRLRPDYRNIWAKKVGEALALCDAYVVTSDFTREIIQRNYNHLETNKFNKIEHGRNFLEKQVLYKLYNTGDNCDLVFYGALNESKGCALMLEMMEINNKKNGPLKLHVIGKVEGKFHKLYSECENVILYGEYNRESLNTYFNKIRPTLTILPSIWHETFSHTLTESWAFGVPVLGTALGAIGERIKLNNGGWTLDPKDAERWYNEVSSIINNHEDYNRKVESIKKLPLKNVDQMAEEYINIYKRLLSSKTPHQKNQEVKTKEIVPHKQNEPEAQTNMQNLGDERLVRRIKNCLLEFGFVDRAYNELTLLSNDQKNEYLQSLACWELALWHANKQTKEDAQIALDFISKISRKEFDENFNQRLALIEVECLETLGNVSNAKVIIANSLAIAPNTDLVLAMANLEVSLQEKLSIINRIYEHYALSLITIDIQKTKSAYDGLTALSLGPKSVPVIDSSAKVTIIVPAFNAEETIATTLNSLIAQTYSNIEIFVVDDCSTDSTREIVTKYEKEDKRIKLIESKINQGPYVARNHALKIATGDFVTCNDSDDWSHPEKISYQVKHLQENPKAVANISQWARVTPELRFYRRNNPGFYMQINLSSLMFRREAVLDKLGYWDSVRYGADTEMHKRLAITFGAESIVELPPVPLSFARYSETSLTGNPVFGYPGFPMGSRKEYRDSYLHFYSKSKDIKYSFPLATRFFPIPWIMDSLIEPKIVEQRHFNLVLVSDFRIQDKNIEILLKDAKSKKKDGFMLGLVHMEIYDLESKVKFDPNVRDLIDGDSVQMLVYGDKVTCDDLVIVHHKVLSDKQMFIPSITPKSIKVIIDFIPDEFENDNLKDSIKSSNDNLNVYFDGTSIWYLTDNQALKTISSLVKSQSIPIVLSNSIWEHPISSYKWEKVQLNIRKQNSAIEAKPEIIKPAEAVENESIYLVDINNIESFSHSNPNGVAVIMPCIDTEKGMSTAQFLHQRAGMDCAIIIAFDTKRQGFIKTLNQTASRCDVAYVVYLAQDAYPGRNWLKIAFDSLEAEKKGLLAFNDGKWRGKIASFGMVSTAWAKKLYGNMILFEEYKSHKADNEITVIAKVTDMFIYCSDSVLIEVDERKDAGGSNTLDDELFKKRFLNGFNGLEPFKKVMELAKEYSTRNMKLVPPQINAELEKQNEHSKKNVVEKEVVEIYESTNSINSHTGKQNEAISSINQSIEFSDTFILYRIIGNDLYPRHRKGQSFENLKFILENEPDFESCEKRFVVNRIIDKEEEQLIIQLLQKHNRQFLHIPFSVDEYQKIGYDTNCLPEPGYLSGKEFQMLDKNKQDRAIASVYRLKNNYIMNNNGARNAALNDGLTRAKWVLPWDGNCFLTQKAWKQIKDDIKSASQMKYFVVPMTRVTNNADILSESFTPDPVEEPQLIFRNDAKEKFNEDFPYGRRPKVELLWRLGVPGKWDSYPKDDVWDLERKPLSPDAGNFGYAGWVARLFSGNEDQEKDNKESIKQRVLARVDAIISTINHVDSLKANHTGNDLTSFNINALEVEKRKNEEGKDAGIKECITKLIALANEAKERGPFSVIDKSTLPPSGNKNDYWHPAPYWWPNPDSKDGLPFIRRDGERVPGTKMYEKDSDKYDRSRLQRVFDDSTLLALAWKFSGGTHYAEHAVRILNTFFIDSKTRMNPNLDYSQIRMGHDENRGTCTGIIATKDFYYYLDAVRILRMSGYLSPDTLGNFKEWLSVFLKWLIDSPLGQAEVLAKNNHGTCYDLQVASIAAFIDDNATLFRTLVRAQTRIPQQFMPDGSQPHELDRTITAHYTCFNFQSWINLAEIASRYNVDLWKYESSNGAGLIKGAEWLVKRMGKRWPYKQIEEFDPDRFLPIWYASQKHLHTAPIHLKIPESKYHVKPVFFPHDGIKPFWNIG